MTTFDIQKIRDAEARGCSLRRINSAAQTIADRRKSRKTISSLMPA